MRKSGDDDVSGEKSKNQSAGDDDESAPREGGGDRQRRRPLRKRNGGGGGGGGQNGGHKYFRRSRASVNVDDPIEEEDEEAVEAENIEVVSLAPPFEVRSILKQRGKEREEKEEEEMGATASTAAIDSATLSPELFLGETRERLPPPPRRQEKPKAKKSVAFADSPVVVPDLEVAASANAFSPLSLSSSGSDDEWSGYDKVVVSHNLAEEILDEIYGKLEGNNDDDKESAAAAAEGGNECDAATSVIYEDVAAIALNPDAKAIADVAAAASAAAAAAAAAKKKTMADEILDELYGGVTATSAAKCPKPPQQQQAIISSPSRSPKSARSRDDSLLPDSTNSASALMMGMSKFSSACIG